MMRILVLGFAMVALAGCRWVAQDQALEMSLTPSGDVTVTVAGYQVGDRAVATWTLPGGGAFASYGTDKSGLYALGGEGLTTVERLAVLYARAKYPGMFADPDGVTNGEVARAMEVFREESSITNLLRLE